MGIAIMPTPTPLMAVKILQMCQMGNMLAGFAGITTMVMTEVTTIVGTVER